MKIQMFKLAKEKKTVFNCSMKIVDDSGKTLPNDGKTFWKINGLRDHQCRRYFKSEETALEEGWFDTGDVATIDTSGYVSH